MRQFLSPNLFKTTAATPPPKDHIRIMLLCEAALNFATHF
jgi:TorA maturation chaperone TorD